jgi:murein DD-endopeptidase MepM/ murein hydrolase activator NlpD
LEITFKKSDILIVSGITTEINNIKSPYTINVNQRLIIPYSSKTYTQTKTLKPTNITSYKQNIPKRQSSKFARPTQGRIISTFGSKSNGLHNDGINIAAKRGSPVKAAENGKVVYASDKIKGLGNIVLIKHSGGWVTAYAHLDKNLVDKGQNVQKGTTIGTVGKTGSVHSPQLHFEVRKNTKPVNPQKYM